MWQEEVGAKATETGWRYRHGFYFNGKPIFEKFSNEGHKEMRAFRLLC